MATGITFSWKQPPDIIIKNLHSYGENIIKAIHAIAAYEGLSMQNTGRANAPWTDRTGAARGGLFFAVDGLGLPPITGTVTHLAQGQATDVSVVQGSGDTLIVCFGHTVWYGVSLELDHQGRYAIVMSTIESHIPKLEQALYALLK